MITVVYCTKETKPKHSEHIRRASGLGKNIEIIEIINNGELSLTQCYNKGLDIALNKIIVFMHDDVTIEGTGFGRKILKHFDNNPEFGILGLAGTTDIPVSGMWWEDRTKTVGIVKHTKDGKTWESKYSKSWGDDINEVAIVDGLFFAVHKDRIKKRFDEDVLGFHFYELNFVLDNYLEGVRVGVMYNIRALHQSVGQTNAQWEINRKQFVEKFKTTLPLKLVPDFYIPAISNKKDVNVPIKVVIQSTGDLDTFKNIYEKIISFNYPELEIALITTDSNFDDLKDLTLDKVVVHEGFYDSLPKNLSVLKFDDYFKPERNELFFFMPDTVVLLNDIFLNFAKVYNLNKKTFGGGFPLSYNDNKTIFSSKLGIFSNKEGKIAIDMKDVNSYYNVAYGLLVTPIGNLADCFVTTSNNFKLLDGFKVNYDTPLYFNEFSLRLFLKNMVIYSDTNSLTVQKSFMGQTKIQEDIQNLVNFIGTDPKLQALVKIVA